jgi:hypothetical protein
MWRASKTMTLKNVVKPQYKEMKEAKEMKNPTLPTVMPRGVPRYARPTRYPSDNGEVIVMPEKTITAEPQAAEAKTLDDGTLVMPELVITAEGNNEKEDTLPENLSLNGEQPSEGAGVIIMPEMVITADPPAETTNDGTIVMPEMEIKAEAGEEGEGESIAPDEDVIVMPEMVIKAGEEEPAPPTSPLSPLPSADEDPNAIVRQWQGGVHQAGSAVKIPELPASKDAPTKVKSGGAAVKSKQEKSRATVNKEAKDAIPPTPKVEPPPAPPANNPIPAQTKAIEANSDKRLPTQNLPPLVPSPKGTVPQLGMKPIPPQMFQLLTTPGALDLAAIPNEKENPERQALKYALKEMTKEIPAPDKDGKGQPVPLVDKGPEPIKPLPPGLKTPVGQVVARLLAAPDEAAKEVLGMIRKDAYPRAVLESEYPDAGQQHLPNLQRDIVIELRLVAEAAGLTGKELDGLIADRQKELEAEKLKVQGQLTTATTDATQQMKDEGQATLDAIAAAKKNNEAEILRRQESASGGNDPTVIEARKKLTVDWVRERVTVQTTNYQEAGEKRVGELSSGQKQQEDAYTYVAQRDEYALLNPKAPTPARDPADQKRERALQDEAAAIRAWATERKESVKTEVRRLKKTANDTTKGYRDAIEGLGTIAILAAETWASERINAGKSWWDRFIAQLTGWSNAAQQGNLTWEVRRTRQTRDGIVQDLMAANQVQAMIAEGATKEQLLASEGLTAEQKAIIEAHFASGGKATPLDLAAVALRLRMANTHRSRVMPTFETELIGKPNSDWKKIDKIVRAITPGFDADKIATEVHAAMDQWGTDEAKIYRNLHNVTVLQASLIRKIYAAKGWGNLDADLEDEMSGDELERAQLQMQGKHGTADAVALHDAVTGAGTDEDAIWDLLRGRSQEEIDVIKAEYKKKYGVELSDRLKEDLDEGNEQDRADALLKGDTATADAIALDEAMRGGFLGTGWGTKEEDIEKTYNTVRDEVKAQAQREGWNTAQMEAEIRRRNAAIEVKFGKRYANVEAYKVPGMEGKSVLRQAFASEMDPGPERDLANALADNDMLAADMARIEIERQSIFYADDDKINGVLRSQYERALEDTRRDEGNARHMVIERKIEAALKADPKMSAEELSRLRFKLEHESERDLEKKAQVKSSVSMEALANSYDKKYGKPLWYVIETNTSGNDRDRARALLKQGGKLTDYQEIRYATKGVGTDEDALKKAVKGRTKAEIEEIRKEWNAKHPNDDFDSMLRGELSGRDEFDVIDMVTHGAPESASEKIAELRRRTDYELNESGVLSGGAVAGNEKSWLKERMEDLEKDKAKLFQRGLPKEERQQLLDEVEFQAGRIETAIEDHRRRVDSVTDMVAQAVGLVVAITVGAALTFLSGGTLGPVMILLIASIAATTSTMATRRLMMGDAYGAEAMGIDAAIGVVDAITAVATAGMGGKLLRGATMAGKVVKPNMVTKVAGNLAKGRLGQVISKVPGSKAIKSGISKLNQMESGFLTKGIKGQNFLSRMAKSDKAMVRFTAEMLAEGVENAVSAAPSAFMGAALDDNNWKGNVPLNLLFGTATGVGQGVAMGLGMGVGMKGMGKLWGGTKSAWHRATPEGRVREGARIMSDAYQTFREKNPGATYTDFHATPEGQKLMGELKQKGMHPDTAFAPPKDTTPSGADKVPDPATHGDTAPAKKETPAPDSTAKGVADPALKTTPPEISVPPKEGGIVTEKGEASPLTAALPERMRKHVTVEVVGKVDGIAIEGNTVAVVPIKENGRIVGVKIVAGPDARPIDVAMHAPTVHAMQKYTGLLGRVRTLLEKMDAWFHLQAHIAVGSTAWEARLEIQKLPFIIEERISRLHRTDLNPQERRFVLDDIAHLEQQLATHQKSFDARDTSAGRGFVAAEGKATPDPKGTTQAVDAPKAGTPEHLTDARGALLDSLHEVGGARKASMEAQSATQKAENLRDQESTLWRQDKVYLEKEKNALDKSLANELKKKQPNPAKIRQLNDALALNKTRTDIADFEIKAINDRHEPTIAPLRQKEEAAMKAVDVAETRMAENMAGVVGSMGERLKTIPGRLEVLDGTIKATEQGIPTLQGELATAKQQHAQAIKEFNAPGGVERVNRTAKEVARLEKELDTAHKGIANAKAEIAQLIKERSLLSKEMGTLREKANWQGYQYDNLTSGKPCFARGTLVHTPSGTRPIESLQVGELVLCYDTVTASITVQPILHCYENWTNTWRVVTVGNDMLFATRHHPFWESTVQDWVVAEQLTMQATLLDRNGAKTTIMALSEQAEIAETYNLEVAEHHNYFVGTGGWLVHNGGGTPKYQEPQRRNTQIYIIYDKRFPSQIPGYPYLVIYVGKTAQGEDPLQRFDQHLKEGETLTSQGLKTYKQDWRKLYEAGELTVVKIAGGHWNDFETAVWEQHYITIFGGALSSENPHAATTKLVNKINAITKETFDKYRDVVMTDENGKTVLHNPC